MAAQSAQYAQKGVSIGQMPPEGRRIDEIPLHWGNVVNEASIGMLCGISPDWGARNTDPGKGNGFGDGCDANAR